MSLGQLALGDLLVAPRAPTPAAERDEVLAAYHASPDTAYERARTRAIGAARAVAVDLAAARPEGITASDVLAEVRRLHPGLLVQCPDTRFMGAVLLPSRGWRKVGERASGHHARKQPIWIRA